jgi:hypothetical protein
MLRPPAALIVVCLSLAVSSPVRAAEADRFISVEGTGTVSAPPDTAMVVAGVMNRAASARQAVDRNNAAMPALFTLLEEMGVKPEDIRTRGFNVAPVYARREPGKGAPGVTGYRASNRIEVTVRDLASLGALLDRLVSAGANTIHGVRFKIGKPRPLLDTARRRAVADARRRARLYAEAAGLRLGAVLRIEERRVQLPQPRLMAATAIRASAPVPIARGQQEIRATIGVTFAIE